MHIYMEENMENNIKRRGMKEIRAYAKQRPKVFTVYVILRLLVVAVLVRSAMLQEYESMFVCLLVLVLFMLPSFLERKLKIELPDTLEIIILVFIFAAEILGELECYFIQYPNWDTILHTTSGFLCAAIGFSLVNLLNKDNRISLRLSPLYMAIAAFCFSMTIGVLWEFIEFSADRLFLLDMDGTIYNENSIFEGTLDFLSQIEKNGGRYIFITNNSSKSVKDYVEKVNRMGITADASHFYTSSQATAFYLQENYPGQTVFCMGTRSLVAELEQNGIHGAAIRDVAEADRADKIRIGCKISNITSEHDAGVAYLFRGIFCIKAD